MATVRKMKNKPKTSPKNLYSCNKTKANIFYKKPPKEPEKKPHKSTLIKEKVKMVKQAQKIYIPVTKQRQIFYRKKPQKKPLKKPHKSLLIKEKLTKGNH